MRVKYIIQIYNHYAVFSLHITKCTHIKICASQVEHFFSLFLSSECTFEYLKYLMHTKGGESCSRHGLDVSSYTRRVSERLPQKTHLWILTRTTSGNPPLSSVIEIHVWIGDILQRASWDQFSGHGAGRWRREETRTRTRFGACCCFFLPMYPWKTL